MSITSFLNVGQEELLSKKVVQYPTSNKLYLKNISSNYDGKIIDFYSIDSKKVYSKKINKNEKGSFVDVSNLSNGVYYYKAGKVRNKFIKT